MQNQPFQDSAAARAACFQGAEEALITSVEQMRRRFSVVRTCNELVRDIKATMHVPLPPHNLTVMQTLYDRERENVFNRCAAKEFPTTRKDFDDAIQDFVIIRKGKTPARLVRKIAANAWKQDPAADRRFQNAGPQGHTSTAYKGRPEIYAPSVVWAFADAIARAAGRARFSIGHHGEVTITHENKGGGVMFRVLVAAVRWAMTVAWLAAAPPSTAPPTVKPEGILRLIKRGR